MLTYSVFGILFIMAYHSLTTDTEILHREPYPLLWISYTILGSFALIISILIAIKWKGWNTDPENDEYKLKKGMELFN